MRQWHVPPRLLCRKHLLGEHVEHHMLIGALKRGKSIAGFVRDALIAPGTVVARHAELAEEMTRRGYAHKSPIDQDTAAPLLIAAVRKYGSGVVDVDRNLRELVRRCPGCRARVVTWTCADAYKSGSRRKCTCSRKSTCTKMYLR